jgi:hypothetical protein
MVEIEVIDCMNDIINQVVRKEQLRLASKKWYEKNREKRIKQKKKYNQTEEGIKSRRISHWKSSGLICDDYNELYNHYLKNVFCDYCKIKLTYDKNNTSTTKCMDHCHETGLFRNILCHSCNIKRRESNF